MAEPNQDPKAAAADEAHQRDLVARAQEAAAEAVANDEEAPAERYVFVKAAPTMGNRMALWDRNPAHPGGEIKVYGQDQVPVKVAADAPEVITALDQKRIVILEGARLERARRQAAKAAEEQAATREHELALRRAAAGQDLGTQDQLAAMQRQIAQLTAELNASRPAESAKAGK